MFPGFLALQRPDPSEPIPVPFPGFEAFYLDPNHTTGGAELVPLMRTLRTLYGENTVRSALLQHVTGGQISARLQWWSVWGILLLDSLEENAVAVCGMILQVFEDDRETVAWEVGTDAFHPFPFLMVASNYAEQEVDVIAGAVSIGQVEVGVIDRRQTPGDQASGYVTERLSAEGVTAIHGRRCRLLMATTSAGEAVVIADGPAGTPRLDTSYAAYRWTIRDTRDTERKTRAFVKGGTTTIVPPGVRDGFGPLGPTVPVNATFRVRTALVSLVGTGPGPLGQAKSIPHAYFEFPEVPWSDNMQEALEAVEESEGSETTVGAHYTPVDTMHPDHPLQVRHWRYPNVAIYWRPLQVFGETDDRWRVLADLFEPTIVSDETANIGAILHLQVDTDVAPYDPPLIVDLDGAEENVIAVRVPAIPAGAGGAGLGPGFYGERNAGYEFPDNDQEVELLLVHNGNASETYPYHLGSFAEALTTGELLRRLYDGEYSPRDPVTGEVVPTNVRYNSAALDAMTDPVAGRITEPVEDLREWAEKHVYAPTGWFPALDYDGRISPLSQVPPDAVTGLSVVNDAIAEARPDWNAGELIVNVLRFTYFRFYYAPESEESGADTLAARTVIYEFRDETSIRRHGEHVQEYEALVSGAVGTMEGDPASIEETGRLQANDRRVYIFDRFRNGAQAVRVAARRSALMFLRTGQFVVLDLSWVPDYVTRRRGAQFVGQVVAIADLNCAWRELLVEEALPIAES